MPTSGQDKIEQQSEEELARIAQISMNVRQAVRNALPAPPEQFFTMMVPGKVLNLDVSPITFPCTSSLGRMFIWDLLFNRILQRVSTPMESRRLLSFLTLSSLLRPFCATICRPWLAFNSVLLAGPSLGVTVLLSPSSAQSVSTQYLICSCLYLGADFKYDMQVTPSASTTE